MSLCCACLAKSESCWLASLFHLDMKLWVQSSVPWGDMKAGSAELSSSSDCNLQNCAALGNRLALNSYLDMELWVQSSVPGGL